MKTLATLATLALLPCLAPALLAEDGGAPLLAPPLVSLEQQILFSARADLNGDGHLDLISSGVLGGPTVVSVGLGDGHFLPQQLLPGSLAGQAPLLRDVTGDGVADLVASVSSGSRVILRPGLGDGTFGAETELISGAQRVLPGLGDVDGDGDQDVIVVSFGLPAGQHDGVHHFLNDGTGGFTQVPVLPSSAHPTAFFVRDLNLDGVPDLIVHEGVPTLALTVRLGLGDGLYAPVQPVASFGLNDTVGLQVADVEGDGDQDLLLLLGDGPQVRVYENPGTGVFSSFETSPLPAGTDRLVVLDRQGDGPKELAASGQVTGQLWLLEGPGFDTWTMALDGLVGGRVHAAADVDGSGTPELLVIVSQPDHALTTVFDISYPAGSLFTNLGEGGLAGTAAGTPILHLEGAPIAGQVLVLNALHAPPATPTWFVVGVSTLELPFKGGLLVPTPDLLVGPLPSNIIGAAQAAAIWPHGLTGFPLWVQAWAQDASGPAGFSASPAARVDVP